LTVFLTKIFGVGKSVKWKRGAKIGLYCPRLKKKQRKTTAQRRRSETEKNILEDVFSSILSQFKNITPLKT